MLNLFGLGRIKFSASIASVLAVIVYYALEVFFELPYYVHVLFLIILLLVCTISFIQHKEIAREDPKEIVADEFAGMYVCLILAGSTEWLHLAILLVLFRVLDIWKFPPFSTIEKKFKNGFGVMADDMAIGIVIGIMFLLFKPL